MTGAGGISTITAWRSQTRRAGGQPGVLPRRPAAAHRDTLLFPLCELSNGRAADLHLHKDGDAVWAILLDMTEERDSAQRMQQKAYDMTLLQEKEAQLNLRLRVRERGPDGG